MSREVCEHGNLVDSCEKCKGRHKPKLTCARIVLDDVQSATGPVRLRNCKRPAKYCTVQVGWGWPIALCKQHAEELDKALVDNFKQESLDKSCSMVGRKTK